MIRKFSKILVVAIVVLFANCTKSDETVDVSSDDATSSQSDYKCGTYNDHQLWTGPRGGCYYINSNDNKTYVDRSYCRCN